MEREHCRTLACTVKSGLGLGPTPNVNGGKEEGKEACYVAQAGLSSYLYRPRVTCAHLSVVEVVSHPPHYI
jgi:hypothetical protein